MRTTTTIFLNYFSVSRIRTPFSTRSLLDWTLSGQLLVHFSDFSLSSSLLWDASGTEAVLCSTLANLGVLLTTSARGVSPLGLNRPVISAHFTAAATEST